MKLVIHGGKPLSGKVRVGGMKNAATPILAATLLTSEPCEIDNVPRITDVERMLQILESLGAEVSWLSQNRVRVSCKNVDLKTLDKNAIQAMRSSVLLIGPLLSRFKKVTIPEPGGCIIGNRPIDTHLNGLRMMGTKIQQSNGWYELTTDGLKGGEVVLPEFSVTATENLLMAASLIPAKTVIKLAAAEPHVQDLCAFLQKLGVKISGVGTHTLEITGAKTLSGASHRIIPDQVEVGTLAVLGAVTKGNIQIEGVEPTHLDLILLKLREIGVPLLLENNTLMIAGGKNLRGFRLQTFPYPGFPTDLQAPFGVLATQCTGTSLIQDPMYEGRMGYVAELVKMGANAIVADPHRVVISGPTPLYGAEIKSLDLRAGATLLIAGLIASGETVIYNAETIDRGYEAIDQKLASLGADIKRVA